MKRCLAILTLHVAVRGIGSLHATNPELPVATPLPSSGTPSSTLPVIEESGLKFGFSTLGCPELDPAGLRALAAKYGSRYVEIRTLGGTTDLVTELAKFPGGAAGVRDFFLESDVRVRLVPRPFS